MDTGAQTVNKGEDDEMDLQGFRRSPLRTGLTWVGIVLTVGFLRLIFHWKPYWYLLCTHVKCCIVDATSIHLKDQYDQDFVETVKYMTSDGVQLTAPPNDEKADRIDSVSAGSGGSLQLDKIGQHDEPAERSDRISGQVLAETEDKTIIRYFVNKKVKYIFSTLEGCYERLRGIEFGKDTSFFYSSPSLDCHAAKKRAALYGSNVLEVHVTPVITLVLRLAVNPFYIFQLFSCILWYTDHYEYYASAILVISIGSIAITVYTTRKMERALKRTVHQFDSATVRRGDDTITVLPTELVPGDIIELPRSSFTIDADAILLSGNCIVNESMLTGESIPVTKTPLPNPSGARILYDPKHHAKHTLFCGTKVIQSRYYGNQPVTAMVIRTGFMTTKGGLIRSIMFPKPVDFKFYRDTYLFIMALALVSLVGMIYTLVLMIKRNDEIGYIVRRTLDLVTIAVPPALPAALAVGIVVAQNRLKKRYRIFCIQPSSINIAGSINVVCFDKTGTLTEDGLDLHGLLPVADKRFGNLVRDTSSIQDDLRVKAGMAACHSLTFIDGELSGDPLDLKMFNATGWVLEEPGEESNRYDVIMPTVVKPKDRNSPLEVGILRQFTFSSSLQRMSVIVKCLSSKTFELYAKGSPEIISSLCNPETLPDDFGGRLAEFTQQGYRVIALAHRPLTQSYHKLLKVDRAEVENELSFLGLLVMENRLKPETIPVISELHKASIRTIMVTGDNILTAVSVGRASGFILPGQKTILVSVSEADGVPQIEYHTSNEPVQDSNGLSDLDKTTIVDIDETDHTDYVFVLTGKVWSVLRREHPSLVERIVVKGAVFARMAPEQKAQLVEELQDAGYYVAMCGDGANDCGALKAAHSGISLSEAEASVASPFTSKNPNIQCVPQLVRAGRGALVTSFGVFKFIAGYSLTQFTSVLILYWIGANVTDFQFLYIDLIIITSLSITFPFNDPAENLYNRPPPVKLASLLPIASLVTNAAIIAGFQVGAFYMTIIQPWFKKFVENDDELYKSYENTSLFDIACFQYIVLAIIYAKGQPYRKNMFTNYWFLGNIIILTGIAVWFIIYPTEPVADLLELELPPLHFRPWYIVLGTANLIVCVAIESLVFSNDRVADWLSRAKGRWSDASKMKYEIITEQLSSVPSWPPAKTAETGFAEVLMRELSVTSTQ